ncbi:uncharacterized protein LOC135099850 isoform X1 [Scylla paramamosain]|uniref:uncharacterized protein LOC135099850 isoform X1 n=2 Tax=Scylla paramamosain TaxID=85552 RepID=UPI003083A73E
MPRRVWRYEQNIKMEWSSPPIVWLVVVVAAAARVWTLPIKEFKPSEISLKNLSPEQLDTLVEVSLKKLKAEIATSYENQLRRHQRDLALLEQRAGAIEQEVPDQLRVRRFVNQQQFWHSYYNFDNHRDREVLRIKNITVNQDLEDITIDKVISLNLWNFAAIYRMKTKMGYALKNGSLRQLLVKNQWTKSLRGCFCNRMGYQVNGVENENEGCACCHSGYCRCPSRVDTCVPCTELSVASCEQHKPRPLLLETAVGFQYYLNNFDTEFGLQGVLIAYYGTKLSLYSIDDDGVQLIKSKNSLDTQIFDKPVTHLGYGEIYKDNDGNITKARYLFSFTAGEVNHRCYTIDINKGEFTIGLQFWKANGTEMKVWQVGWRVMVAILYNDGLVIRELVQSLRRRTYELRYLQEIRVGRGAPILSWTSFTMAFENYLVVVTADRAKVLHLGKNYTRVQDLAPESGMSAFSAILPINMPWWRGRAVLLTGQGRQLVAYVWSSAAQRFHQAYTMRLDVGIRDWKISFAFFDSSRSRCLVFVQGDSVAVTLRIEANLEDVEDPVASQIRALHGIVQPLKDELKQQSQVLEDVRSALQHSASNKDLITGNITVLNGIRVQGTLATGVIEAEKIILESRDSSGQVTRQQYEEEADWLLRYHTVLDTLNQTIVSVHNRLDDAVPINGSKRLITGRKAVLTGGIHVSALTIDRLAVGRPLDARGKPLPLDDILTSVVRYNDTRVVSGKKIFLQPLSVGNLRAKYLDDIPIDDMVTSGGNHKIAGTTIFSRLIAQTVKLSSGETVAGIDISEEIVTLNGDVALGTCNFEGVTVDALTAISKKVDEVDIQRLRSRALTTLGGTIQGSLSFVSPPAISTLNANKIMGVNIAKFMSTTVFRHKPAIMSGRLAIPSVEVRGDVVVDGLINGKKFPDDYVINTGRTIDFGVQWYKEVHFRSLSLGPQCRVDGLLPSSLVTLHTPQTITGLKRFAGGVYIEGDLDIPSKIIDGINMDELNNYLTNIKSGSWKFDVVFEQFVSAPSVFCSGTLNGLDWASFMNDIVYDDVPSVLINSTKIFSNGLTVEEAIFHKTFNGENFSNLVNIAALNNDTSNQVITGGKTFLNDVAFESMTTQLVAGIDLKEMANRAVYLNKVGQTVYGIKTFTETLSVEDLVVTGNIKNLDIDKIVRKSIDQVFTVPQSLRHANFSDMEVISINMAQGHTINGVDIALLNMRRVSLTSPGYYPGVLTIEGSMLSHAALTVGIINGYRADQLTSNLVMKDQFTVITGNVKFTALTVDGPVTTHNQTGANGHNITDISLRAIHLSDDVMITGDATWGDLVFQRDVAVEGLVNGVNLRKLSHDVVYLDQTSSHIITGKKTFKGGLTVQGNLEATTINGIDLRTRLLTRHTEQTITSLYYFVDVDAKAALYILGLYNNRNLAGLASFGLSGTDVIRGNVIFHGEVTTDHLHIAGHYNGVNVTKRMSDSISLYESSVNITGMKNFTANVTFQTVDTRDVNLVPMVRYFQHVVLSNSSTNFGYPVHVNGTVWAPFVSADSVVVEGSVSGVDYDKLLREAIYLDRNQSISSDLVFTKDIKVQGAIHTTLLNHLSMTTQYLTTSTPQTLPASLVLGTATTARVDVGGLVNSWRLSEEVKATMKAVGGQVVYGSMSLMGSVEVVTDVQVTGLVGLDEKLDLSRQAVSLHHNTQIQGLLLFKVPIVASSLSSPSGVVNGVDVEVMLASAWYLDQRTVVNVPVDFKGPVVFEGALLTNNTLDPSRLQNLQHQLISAVTHHSFMAENLSALYRGTCSRIEPLYKQLENAIYEADFFKAVYEDQLPHHRHASEVFRAFNTTYFVVSWRDSCETVWYYFKEDPFELVLWEVDLKFRAHEWLFLGGTTTEVYVAAAAAAVTVIMHSGSPNSCNVTSAIWKITRDNIVKHGSLESGERLSMFAEGNLVTLRVHAADSTAIYKLDLLSGSLLLKQTVHSGFDIYKTTVTPRNQTVTFRGLAGHGMLLVDDYEGEVVKTERSIDDCVFVEEDGRLYLLLALTRAEVHRDEFLLELHSVDVASRTLTWESVHRMAAKTRLTVFFAGSRTTGAYIVVALQENGTPLVYSLVGATLKEFASLSTPGVSWAEYVAVPSQVFPPFPDHYLLLGQYNKTSVLTQLVMRGGAVPQTDYRCYQEQPVLL